MVDAPGNLGWGGVRLWEVTDPVQGGDATAVSNVPLNQLASRDQVNRDEIAELRSALAAQINGGRMTISASDPAPVPPFRANSKIVYWLPYSSNRIALWTGSAWEIFEIPLSGLQINTASWATPQTRDVFAYWDNVAGQIALETRIWANPNRIADRGYVIEDFQGVKVLQSNRTRRYLGCIYNSAQSTLATPGIHADQNMVDYWNVDNQIERVLVYATDETLVTIAHATPRIAKGAMAFDFFRLVTGDPLQVIRMSGCGQLINGTSVNNAFYNLNFGAFNDRVSDPSAARVYAGTQITASANAGLVGTEAYFYAQGAQTLYLQDFKSATGADPRVQFVRAGMTWRY